MTSGYDLLALGAVGREIARLSKWIDAANAHRDPEARTWGRMAKVAEEAGEVITEMILRTGQNPRKPQTANDNALLKENLDVAITALGNVEHLTGNQGTSMHRLIIHLANVVARAEQAGMNAPKVTHIQPGGPVPPMKNGDRLFIQDTFIVEEP